LTEKTAPRIPCFESSLESNEEMFGSAPRVDVWLLLEYPGHWTKDAFDDSRIPAHVKSGLSEYLDKTPNSRLQLIKKSQKSGSGIAFYIAISSETEPRLFELKLDGYEDLLDLNIDSILSDKRLLRSDPLFLVCTNGEHDGCCGRFGMPVYLDIEAGGYGSDTWETTHLGGHRFASTFVCLPHGLYYGRVREGQAAEKIMDDYVHGNMNLRSLRGRTCYEKDVQAAEYFLRKETGDTELSAFRFKDKTDNEEGKAIRFEDVKEQKAREVRLRRYDNTLKITKSCGDEPTSIPKYMFRDLIEL